MMLSNRSFCCGSLFLSGFLIWQSSIQRKGNEMSAKCTGGLTATNELGKSPFVIYRNVLDIVMSRLSLDEDAAIDVILNELCCVNDWMDLYPDCCGEIRESQLNQRANDWHQAWLN